MDRLQHRIECVRCGEEKLEFLTEEELEKLNDAVGPIYRPCSACDRTTGWIGSTKPEPATKNLQNSSSKKASAKNSPAREQKRMATQAERDRVNSLVSKEQ